MTRSTMSAGLSYLLMTPDSSYAYVYAGESNDKAIRLPARLGHSLTRRLCTSAWFDTYYGIQIPESDDRLLQQYAVLDDRLGSAFD